MLGLEFEETLIRYSELCMLNIYLSFTAPDFVSSTEDEDYVYFFFREAAVEYINCGKVKTQEIQEMQWF